MDGPLRSASFLLVLVLVAALVGVAAVALLGAPQTSPVSHPPPSTGELQLNLPSDVWALLFLAPLLVGIAGAVIRNRRQPHSSRGGGALVILLLVGVVLLFLLAHGGGGGGLGSIGFPTSPPPSNTTQGTGHNITLPSPSNGSTYRFQIPTLVLWVAAGSLCLLVGVLTIPAVAGRISSRFGREPKSPAVASVDREAVAQAMGAAASALEQGAEPRETIVGLYLRLLARLSPVTGELTYQTADEIRRIHLAPLGVPEETAAVLTQLFEEARYSTHPIAPATVATARQAFRAAESSIRQGAAGS